MKKLHYFFSFILLSLVGIGSASAQYFVLGDEMVTTIEDGQTYGLQSATSTQTRLLNGYEVVSKFSDDCLFIFEDTGRKADGYTVWRLKQKTTGKYIKHHELTGWQDSSDEPPHDKGAYVTPYIEYTDDIKEAFGFTILPSDTASTDIRRNCVEYKNENTWMQDPNGFVLCSEKTHFDEDGKTVIPTYLGYYGNVFLSPWNDTNVWKIFTLVPAEGKDLIRAALRDVGGLEPNNVNFPVGTNPGQVSQEAFDRYADAYGTATGMLSGTVDNDAAKDAVAELIAARENIDTARVPVSAGAYYLVKNKASGTYLYDGDGTLRHNDQITNAEAPVLEDAKYIFYVEDADSLPYFKNFGSGKYVGEGSPYPLGDTPVKHTFSQVGATGDYFYIWNAGNGTGVDRFCRDASHGTVTAWHGDDDSGQRLWQFIPVSADVIKSLEGAVLQAQLNEELAKLYSKASKAYSSGRKFTSEATPDGFYDATGLLINGDQLTSNSIAGTDIPANLVDGDFSTIYHSAWQDNIPAEASYLQFTLDEAQKTLQAKMTKRMTNLWASNPTAFNVQASADGETWYNEGSYAFTYDYATQMVAEDSVYDVDNSTAIFGFDMSEPYRFIRFVIEDVVGEPELKNGHPIFYLSELQLYPATYDPANSVYEQVPANLRTAFETALGTARVADREGKATREVIEGLQKAYDEFIPYLPMPDVLLEAIAEAKALSSASVEGAGVGMHKVGSKAVLDTAIVTIERSIQPLWGVTELNAANEQLKAALDAFAASINMPRFGKMYIIRSASAKRAEANDQYVYANGYGTNAGLRYGGYYPDSTANVNVAERAEYLWFFEKVEGDVDSLILSNVASGLHVAANGTLARPNNKIILSLTKAPANELNATKGSYSFTLKLDSVNYLNVGGGGSVVAYSEANDANSAFVIEEAPGFVGEVRRPIEAGKTQVICLPYEVENYVFSGDLYSVLGENEGKMMLQKIEDEVIPAATPVIYVPSGDVTEEKFTLTSGEDVIPTYNHYGETVNGLRGTVIGDTIPEGCGYISADGKIIVRGSAVVNLPAGSGYFTGRHAKGVEATDTFLVIDGEIVSVGSVLVDGAAQVSVYTLDGVCIRKNVAAAAATNGLPAGLYIVGSKVVLVK